MARLFGTDGVRGIANDTLTPELAYHLGRAAAYVLGQEKEHPTFLIGRDTRISGTMLGKHPHKEGLPRQEETATSSA